MTAPASVFEVSFDVPTSLAGIFTLDSSLLDGTDVLLGVLPTDISGYVRQASFTRGRADAFFDAVDPADGIMELNNHGREFDPLNTTGAFYGNFTPGKEVRITTAGVRIFTGGTKDWQVQYDRSGQAIANVTFEDGLAVLGRQEFDEWTATAGQTADQRLTDILNRTEVGWPGGARSFETGTSTLQGDAVSWGSNVLNYCQLVAQSELGTFFADRSGVLVFHARSHNAGGSPGVIFADDGVTERFFGVGLSAPASRYFTRVSVDREGGIAQTVSSSAAQIRSKSLSGLLLDSDVQSYNMAEFLHTTLSAANERVERIEVFLTTERFTTDQIAAILRLDLGDLLGFSYTPLGVGSAITSTLSIVGIAHDITPEAHVVTFHTDLFANRNAFILDDPVMGLLDGVGVLTF